MSLPSRKMRCRPAIAVLLIVGWTAPASAAPFTATWKFGLHGGNVPDPNPTPFYDCDLVGSGGLICAWLWEQGLEVTSATGVPPLYGDGGPSYDAFGFDLPLASDNFFGDELLQIVPECRPGLQPCFATFTPISVVADSFFSQPPVGGVFFTSSRGGLVTSPDGHANFAGPEWTDIAWMYVGLYRPDECEDIYCRSGEQWLHITSLTFDAEPIPEPASVLLLGSGLLALVRRYRRRA